MKVTNEEKFANIESTGSQNGPHHFFRCQRCKAPLCDVWVNYPNSELKWNMKAECGHCGGYSDEQEICGMFAIGHTEESEKYTDIDSYDWDSNPIIIKTKARSKYV